MAMQSGVHRTFSCIVLLCLFSLVACRESPKEKYQGLSPGGYLKKASSTTYDVFTVSRDGAVHLITGQYEAESEVPGFLKRRIPLSVQRMFTVKTEMCGNLKFAEPLVGRTICRTCEPYSLRHWKDCPLNQSRVPFEWAEL